MTAVHKTIEHIIDQQNQAEEKFLAEYRAGMYSLETPFVVLNPYLIAPLTALIMFETEAAVSISITVKGREEDGDFHFTTKREHHHVIPVYGLRADVKNAVLLSDGSGNATTVSIDTSALPDLVKRPTYVKENGPYMKEQLMFVSPTSDALIAGYDYRGDCRWYCTLNIVFAIHRLSNGNLLIGTERLVAPPYNTSGLYEMSLIGKIYNEYRIPGSYHHDHAELDNGDLIALTQDLNSGSVEDMVVLLDRKTGEIKKTWDLKQVLPMGAGAVSEKQNGYDWFHNNAVWYDKKTNSLSLSGRNEDAVVNLDFETGDINWILGDPECWPSEMVERYFFKPMDENLEWCYGQHSCQILPDGDVMVFDNGCWRKKSDPEWYPEGERYSRGVRYEIDCDNMTIRQKWQYGKERGEEIFSPNISNIDYYKDGHYLVHFGSNGHVNGRVCTRTPMAHLAEGEVIFNSVTVELLHGEVQYELRLPASYFRAKKLPLYNETETLIFSPGKQLGCLGKTEEFETEPPAEDGGEVPDSLAIEIREENDRFILHGRFENGQIVMVILERGSERHRYYVPTTKHAFSSICVGTFIEHDERIVNHPINKEGLNGTYAVRLLVDDKIYDTGVFVDCGK